MNSLDKLLYIQSERTRFQQRLICHLLSSVVSVGEGIAFDSNVGYTLGVLTFGSAVAYANEWDKSTKLLDDSIKDEIKAMDLTNTSWQTE